ncbi:MAG: HAD family phosphatase [Oscillospiraceae bacterium]|nr:HAD family phosphatase [Oscillospiraceae bacterium]
MNFKAVIFDMDGTLVDSLRVWAESDIVFLNRHGYEYDPSVSEAMKTMHYVSACEYLKERFDIPMSVEDIGSSIMEIVKHKYVNEVPLKEGVYDFMLKLKADGVKMCVATSNDKSLAEAALKSLGIYEMLEFIMTSDEVGCGKESPVIFEKCAEKMGATPSETAVFEDSVHAAGSAYGAGFYTVGVYEENFRNEFEKLRGCTHKMIRSFKEVL